MHRTCGQYRTVWRTVCAIDPTTHNLPCRHHADLLSAREMFDQIDLNGAGRLSHNELVALVERMWAGTPRDFASDAERRVHPVIVHHRSGAGAP